MMPAELPQSIINESRLAAENGCVAVTHEGRDFFVMDLQRLYQSFPENSDTKEISGLVQVDFCGVRPALAVMTQAHFQVIINMHIKGSPQPNPAQA